MTTLAPVLLLEPGWASDCFPFSELDESLAKAEKIRKDSI